MGFGFEIFRPEEDILMTPCLATVASILAVCLAALLWRRRFESMRDSASSLPLPPGGFGWPLVGDTLHFIFSGVEVFEKKMKQFGGIYTAHILGSPVVRTESGQRISQLVGKEPQSLTVFLPDCPRFVFGYNGVITASGQEHATMKRSLKQAFTPTRLADYLPCIQACIRRHVTAWTEEPSDDKLLGFDICRQLVCDLVLETVVGCTEEQDPHGKIRQAFVVCSKNLFSVPIAFPGSGFYKVKKARQVVVDFVKSRLASPSSTSLDDVNILDILISHHRKQETPVPIGETTASCSDHEPLYSSSDDPEEHLSDAQLVDNAVSLLLAGSDTMSSALCSVMKMLGKHPDKLEAVRKELVSADLLNNGRGGDLSYDLVANLPYTRAVAKEVLRMLPPVGAAFRWTKKLVELEDYQIPKDWRVMYSIRGTHQQTDAFLEKHKFIPERWLEKDIEEKLRKTSPCSYAPFGFGSRSCLGKELGLLEMCVFVVEVARLTEWTLLNPDARRVFMPVEKPFDNLPLVIRKRN